MRSPKLRACVGVRSWSTISRSTLREGADDELVQLVGREHSLGVDPGPVLRYDIDDVDPRRVGQFAQSRDMDLDFPGAAAGGGRDQDRVLEICDARRAGAVRERGLAVADPPLEVEADPRRRLSVCTWAIELPQHVLTVGPTGRVEAQLSGKSVVVLGKVNGRIHASELVRIGETGSVEGAISAPRLVVADGARLQGCVDV